MVMNSSISTEIPSSGSCSIAFNCPPVICAVTSPLASFVREAIVPPVVISQTFFMGALALMNKPRLFMV